MQKYIRHIYMLNFKTIYFNFKYLPFKQAIKFPFLISNKVNLFKVSGKIYFDCLIRPGLVKIGYGGVTIFDAKVSRSIWDVSGKVIFKGSANIGHGSKISVGSSGTLVLGDNFVISAESSIVSFLNVQFGKDCLLSWDILVMDTDFHNIKNSMGEIVNNPQPIIIGDKVWIGCRCIVLKGTTIPNNCIIGANSLLCKQLEDENCLYAGNPVKCIKEKVTWQ
jgi:acetyltransferase-like isoleucine patch superfamily enzyme